MTPDVRRFVICRATSVHGAESRAELDQVGGLSTSCPGVHPHPFPGGRMARNVVDLRPRRSPAEPPDRWFDWRFEHHGADVTVVESPSGLAPTSQDAWLALAGGAGVGGPGALRLAAFDGATPPPSAPRRCGIDAATWAAQVTRAALHADDDIAVCLWRANRTLFDGNIASAGARPQSAVVVADVRMRWDGDPHAQVVRASDCV